MKQIVTDYHSKRSESHYRMSVRINVLVVGGLAGAVALTAAIVEAFTEEAQRRGKRARVETLPGARSFRVRAKFGEPVYAPF
jgi:hypothetical protein